VAGSEHELPVPIIGREFLGQLNDYKLIKKDYAPWSYDGKIYNGIMFTPSF
jgi:hypothetical protein